ncbi:hypothetical protein PRIPAC_84281 [Pristionchus pacificus]|uniref:Uncharacterized protein n=1 Tax=Pristionchus pacificus TaxID=54126 RepID=A0A2A6BKP6_PRIPA|nr:hypothetical protein PRIPAC_84281 [Pristionchus pacificus]|eukprot:PDM66492.1 hypothetical protein PRIPAC_47909 [Pristionchus pacificus]
MLLKSLLFVVLVAYVIHSAPLNTDSPLPEKEESSQELNCTRLPGFMPPSKFGSHEIVLINGNGEIETIALHGFQNIECDKMTFEDAAAESDRIQVVTMSTDDDTR